MQIIKIVYAKIENFTFDAGHELRTSYVVGGRRLNRAKVMTKKKDLHSDIARVSLFQICSI